MKRENSFTIQKMLYVLVCLIFVSISAFAQNTPLALNGRLKLNGNQLCNENGKAIQLRGMSTHGLQWFGNCVNDGSIKALVSDWGIDIIRPAMYVDEGGYLSNPQGMKDKVNQVASLAASNGIYCIIDWHMLTPGSPMAHVNEAKSFFAEMAQKYAGQKHIIYEICNEPNNIDWPTIKGYAEQVVPVIRQYDKEAIIIVGTPTWSGEPMYAANNPLTGSNAYNLMYTFHFYAGSHYSQNYINDVLKRIPLFVTEWGTSDASGNSGNDYNNAQNWLDLFSGANSAGVKVSWCNWSFCDKNETSAALNGGACSNSQWNNTTYSGAWVKNHILVPADDFTGGVNPETQSPYTGVINLPGIVETENYDNGGEGVSYHDNDAANLGGKFRTNYGVDIEACGEGGFNIGYLNAGEWLEYSVNVASSGSYKLDTRFASALSGGSFHIELNDVNVTGTITVTGTGGWQTWTTASKTVALNAGQQVLKIYIETAGFNLNNINVTAQNISGSLVNGAIYKIISKYSGLACDVESVSTFNGANVQQWSYGGGKNQKWTAYDLGNGYWKLINLNSGKCLEVASYSTMNGGNVQQWDYVGNNFQQWSITSVGDGSYKVLNRGSGLSLDVAGVSLINGANIQQWTYGGGENQKWFFQSVDSGAKVASGLDDPLLGSTAFPVMAYPNPASEKLIIDLSGFNSVDKTITLSNVNNVVCLEKIISGDMYELDISGLPSGGMYILKVKDFYSVKVEKIMVSK